MHLHLVILAIHFPAGYLAGRECVVVCCDGESFFLLSFLFLCFSSSLQLFV